MTPKENYKMYLQEIRIGDKIEWLFHKIGVKWLVHKIYPKCRCEQRKEWLNGELNLKRK